MENTIKERKKITEIIIIILRIIAAAVSAGMIYWYMLSGFLAFGNVAGIFIFTVISMAAVFWQPLLKFLHKLRRKRAMKIITDILLVLILLFFVYAVSAIGLMIYGSEKKPEKGSTVVVLGCQVRGTQPSHTLKMRLDAAYSYLSANPETKAVLSGGKGTHEDISEAQCMYNYLTDKGIDSTRLYLEDRSTTTQENIRFAKEIIERNNLNPSIAVVTDWYHEFRAGIICKRQGVSYGAVSADTPAYLTAHLVTREIFAIPNEILFKGN